jgi:5-methylcytosine-specific restriction endonuclease McrA
MGWVKKGDILGKIMLEHIQDNLPDFCEKCDTNKNLTIHHKKSRKEYPLLEFELENCQRLCVKCHRESHKRKPKL